MKSERAEELLFKLELSYPYSGYLTTQDAEKVADLAEEDAEATVRDKAIKAFCVANCPKGCSFGADGNIGCGAKARFIQKLNEE